MKINIKKLRFSKSLLLILDNINIISESKICKITLIILLLGNLSIYAQQRGGGAKPKLLLKANLKAYTSGTTLAINGQTVETWFDESYNGNDASQGVVSKQPIFRNNITDNANYNPVIEISNSVGGINRDYFIINNNDNGDFSTVADARVNIIVARPTGSPDDNSLLFMGNYALPNNGDFTAITLNTTEYKLDCGSFLSTSSATNNSEIAIYTFHLPEFPANTGDFELQKNSYDFTETETGGVEPVTTDNNYAILGGGNSSTGLPTTFWNGFVAEVYSFASELSVSEFATYESYLAIKYGITLNNTDGGTKGDYHSSSGTQFWDASDGPLYQNDVIGLYNDENIIEHQQKQSHSNNDSTRIYLSTIVSNNASNTGSFSSDLSFVVMGHNLEKMNLTSTAELPTGFGLVSRVAREWKVTKTNFNQSYNCDFVLNAMGAINTSDLRFLVDDDGDFTNGGTSSYYNGDGTGIVISYSNPEITISNIYGTHIANNSTKYISIGAVDWILPVELLSFDALIDNNKVELIWETASEINNEYFVVERSTDNYTWEVLTKINGEGNSSSNLSYSAVDYNPYLGTSYYRLKQFDFDGLYSYSNIRTVNFENILNSEPVIYPNPTLNLLIIEGNKEELNDLKIYSLLGQDVTSVVKILEYSNSSVIVSLSNLSQGVYFIKTKSYVNSIYKID